MNTSPYFKSLKIVHLAVSMGVSMFLAITVALQSTGMETLENQVLANQFLPYIAGIAVAGCLASQYLFGLRLKKIRQLTGLDAKTTAYRGALIMKWTLLDAPALLSGVFYLITGSKLFLVCAALPLILLILSKPTKDKSYSEMELTWEEQQQLDQEQAPPGSSLP